MLETNLVSALKSVKIDSLKWAKPWEPLLTPGADTYIWLAEPFAPWTAATDTLWDHPLKNPDTKLMIITHT